MKTVYQTDRFGLYAGNTVADESQLEPGVYHIPRGAVEAAPPESWPAEQWPRWNGATWELVTKPTPPEPKEPEDPTTKLLAFLEANPDVAAMIGAKT